MNTKRGLKGRRYTLQWMTGTAMMIAVTLVLGATPLGLIRTPVLNATTLHVPVIIATLVLGLESGIITGLVFGVQSFFNSFTTASFFSPFFINPLVSVLPRVLFPCCVHALAAGLSRLFGGKEKGRFIQYIAASALGTALHTAMVMGMIYLLYAKDIAGMLTGGLGAPQALVENGVGAGIAAMAVSNGVPEMIVAAVIAPVVAAALNKALGRMRVKR